MIAPHPGKSCIETRLQQDLNEDQKQVTNAESNRMRYKSGWRVTTGW